MKQLSEELTDDVIKDILYKSERAPFYGNCACCTAGIRGTHYDVLRDTPRICQLCNFLGEEPDYYE